MRTFLIVGGSAAAVCVAVAMLGLAYFVAVSPEDVVQTGPQIPKNYVSHIRELGLLESGETIQYFYSDALLDFKSSFCFVSDRKLLLYSTDWEEPAVPIPFDQIDDLTPVYSTSWMDYTYGYVTLQDGTEHLFQLSNTGGGDRRFVDYVTKMQAAATPPPAEEPAPSGS